MLLCKVMNEIFSSLFQSLFSLSCSSVSDVTKEISLSLCEFRATSWSISRMAEREKRGGSTMNSRIGLKRHDTRWCCWLELTEDDTKHEPKYSREEWMKRKVVKFMLTMSRDWLPLKLREVRPHAIIIAVVLWSHTATKYENKIIFDFFSSVRWLDEKLTMSRLR